MTPEISIQNTIDLDAYTSRIGFDGDLTPTEETLHALHFAHATHIPFENLSLFLGQPIRIDIPGDFRHPRLVERTLGAQFGSKFLFVKKEYLGNKSKRTHRHIVRVSSL